MRVIKPNETQTTSVRARMDRIRAAGFDPTDWTREEISDAATQIDRVRYLECLRAVADARQRRGRLRAGLVAALVLGVSAVAGFVVGSALRA